MDQAWQEWEEGQMLLLVHLALEKVIDNENVRTRGEFPCCTFRK